MPRLPRALYLFIFLIPVAIAAALPLDALDPLNPETMPRPLDSQADSNTRSEDSSKPGKQRQTKANHNAQTKSQGKADVKPEAARQPVKQAEVRTYYPKKQNEGQSQATPADSEASPETKKARVVFIVLDGVRTREFFRGAGKSSHKPLLPFVHRLARSRHTVVLGNHYRRYHPHCTIDNPAGLSLPAYADLLSGHRQHNVNDNRFRGRLPNITIPDMLYSNGISGSQIRIYASWEPIKNIVSALNSPVYIETGYSPGLRRPPWGHSRYDYDLYRPVKSFLQQDNSFRFLFVAFNDTDEWAHMGRFNQYAGALKRQDNYIKRLYYEVRKTSASWEKTTLIITTDHGRGGPGGWSSHSGSYSSSRAIWGLVYSPQHIDRISPRSFVKDYLGGQCSHTSLGRYALRVLLDQVN